MIKAYFTTLCLLTSFSSYSIGPFSNGRDFDHDNSWRNRRANVKVEVKDCTIVRGNSKFHLNSSKYNLSTVFKLIETTSSGRELVSKLRPLIKAKSVLIKDLTSTVRHTRGLSNKTSALYDFTLDTPTIFISFKDEIGLVAHFLVHEASHALDELIPLEYEKDMQIYKNYKEVYNSLGLDIEPMKILTESETKLISTLFEEKKYTSDNHAYRAERAAFDQQGIFTQQILEVNDCYSSYLEEHRLKNGLKLYKTTPDAHIFNSYGISPSNIR